MAKQYKAITKIVVGTGNGDRREIEAGDVVTGLSKDQMVELWNASVLTEVDEEQEAAADERDARIAELEQQLAEARAAKASDQVPQGDTPDADEDGTQPANPDVEVQTGTTKNETSTHDTSVASSEPAP